MAVDTANKRASVIGYDVPFLILFPTPDGSINTQLDRMQILGQYGSIGGTPGDSDPPSYTTAPFITGFTDTTATVQFIATDVNFPITLWAVRLADAATAPSAAQVKAGTDSTDSAAPNNSTTVGTGVLGSVTFAGLTQSTAYDIFVAAEDNIGNITTVAKLDVTTAATPSYDNNAIIQGVVSSGRMIHSVIDDVT